MSKSKPKGKWFKRQLVSVRELQDLADRRGAPLLDWRDVQHPGIMAYGVCIRCYGAADDPRHWGAALLDGRAYVGTIPLSSTVFFGLSADASA